MNAAPREATRCKNFQQLIAAVVGFLSCERKAKAVQKQSATRRSTVMKLTMFATALLAFSSTIAMAQSSATIAQRKINQQDRIAQGIRSGELTPRETAHLESREASINREERNMRRADDGHLTAGDRAALTARQNRVSSAIYRDKHNGR
jgi:hypothetical protein